MGYSIDRRDHQGAALRLARRAAQPLGRGGKPRLGQGPRLRGRAGHPPVYRSYEELLADPNIDMVYIPLPHKRHAEGAVKAAPAGKHALVEQPLVTSRADLDAIEAAARDNYVVISRPSCRCTRCRPAWCWR